MSWKNAGKCVSIPTWTGIFVSCMCCQCHKKNNWRIRKIIGGQEKGGIEGREERRKGGETSVRVKIHYSQKNRIAAKETS